jgi:pre-mRNA-splicing factor 38A
VRVQIPLLLILVLGVDIVLTMCGVVVSLRYLRALAAFYIRLTFRSMEIYETLEPLMKDFKKLRVKHEGQCCFPTITFDSTAQTHTNHIGGYSLTHFDQFIDELLTQERVCDIILPRLTKRSTLEESEGLAPRKSLLVRFPHRNDSPMLLI